MADENGNGDDWSNVRFRPRRVGTDPSGDNPAQARFVQGALLFVVVALAYPWYSYWVQSHLLTEDSKRALARVDEEMRAIAAQAEAPLIETSTVDASRLRRTSSPRIVGISEGAATSVIVADMDGAALIDSERRLCADATRWTGRSTAGRTFRVQGYRGSQPAVTIGSIRC
jgi:hypothetical protein